MGKSRKACIAGVCILLAVVAVASFFIGYKVAVDKNKTSWTKEETEIALSDLVVNDMVSITFAGEIQETYPARIMNVIKVQLLGENLD